MNEGRLFCKGEYVNHFLYGIGTVVEDGTAEVTTVKFKYTMENVSTCFLSILRRDLGRLF